MSSWLQIQRSRFDSRRYQIFCEVVSLERGPISLVSTNEELIQRKSSSSGLGNREYGRRDPSCWSRDTLYPQKVDTKFANKRWSLVGIVHSWTKAMEFIYFPSFSRRSISSNPFVSPLYSSSSTPYFLLLLVRRSNASSNRMPYWCHNQKVPV
jgi:hypothetical protein